MVPSVYTILRTVHGVVKVSSKWSAMSQNFLKYAYFIVKAMPILYSSPKYIQVCFSSWVKEWFAPNIRVALSSQEDAPCLGVGRALRNIGLKYLVCPLPGFRSEVKSGSIPTVSPGSPSSSWPTSYDSPLMSMVIPASCPSPVCSSFSHTPCLLLMKLQPSLRAQPHLSFPYYSCSYSCSTPPVRSAVSILPRPTQVKVTYIFVCIFLVVMIWPFSYLLLHVKFLW